MMCIRPVTITTSQNNAAFITLDLGLVFVALYVFWLSLILPVELGLSLT